MHAVRLIRSPIWDGVWLLSGLPIGLLLVLTSFVYRPALLFFAAAAVLLEVAHTISPIAMSWWHPDLRKVILSRPWWHIVLPWSLCALAVAVGLATSLGLTSYQPGPRRLFVLTDWRNPYPIAAWVFWLWNIWHFGSQWYGVARLYGADHWHGLAKLACLGIAVAGMAFLPASHPPPWVLLLAFGIISFNHWLTEIGLCSAVMRRWWWIPALLAIGCIGFVWKVPQVGGNLVNPQLGWAIPTILCAWFGLGFVHFLTGRCIWRRDRAVMLLSSGRA